MYKRKYVSAVAIGFMLISSFTFAGTSDIPNDTLSQIGPTLAKQFTYEPFSPLLKDHIWMDIGDGRLFFLHFDRPVSEKGAKLIFIGDGIKGKFCAEDQPYGGKTGFVHFHRKISEGDQHDHNGHGGHGGEAGRLRCRWLYRAFIFSNGVLSESYY